MGMTARPLSGRFRRTAATSASGSEADIRNLERIDRLDAIAALVLDAVDGAADAMELELVVKVAVKQALRVGCRRLGIEPGVIVAASTNCSILAWLPLPPALPGSRFRSIGSSPDHHKLLIKLRILVGATGIEPVTR